MRVNDVFSRCRTDQNVKIYYEGIYIEGTAYDIVTNESYRLKRIGDMLVTRINSYENVLSLKVVKA